MSSASGWGGVSTEDALAGAVAFGAAMRAGQDSSGEDATTLDGPTDPGDPATYAATPGQFAARWNAASEERRAEIVRAWQDAAAVGHRCFEMDHDGQVEALRRVIDDLRAQLAASPAPTTVDATKGNADEQ